MQTLYGVTFTSKQIKAINKLLIKVKINNIMDFDLMIKSCQNTERIHNDLMDCITQLQKEV